MQHAPTTLATDDEFENFAVVCLTSHRIKSAHYFHGVYIFNFVDEISDIIDCMSVVMSLYPALENVEVSYMLDSDLLIIFTPHDVNLSMSLQTLKSEYPDVDVFSINSPFVPEGVSLDVLDMSTKQDYVPVKSTPNVSAAVCVSSVPYEYTQFAINHSVSTGVTTIVFFGGALIDFN